MSKVEMSIQEYNQLMDELNMYKEIVNAVTSPQIDSWDLHWFKEHPESSLCISSVSLMESLSLKSREYVRQKIANNISRIMSTYSIEGEINPANDYSSYLCSIQHQVQEVEEEV